ncbi:hypothetical protein Tco_0252428 [Tanacetum coccineum]
MIMLHVDSFRFLILVDSGQASQSIFLIKSACVPFKNLKEKHHSSFVFQDIHQQNQRMRAIGIESDLSLSLSLSLSTVVDQVLSYVKTSQITVHLVPLLLKGDEWSDFRDRCIVEFRLLTTLEGYCASSRAKRVFSVILKSIQHKTACVSAARRAQNLERDDCVHRVLRIRSATGKT